VRHRKDGDRRLLKRRGFLASQKIELRRLRAIQRHCETAARLSVNGVVRSASKQKSESAHKLYFLDTKTRAEQYRLPSATSETLAWVFRYRSNTQVAAGVWRKNGVGS
jgi:hypothetical protein